MTTDTEILTVLKKELTKLLPDINENDVTTENTLRELGANSIDRFEVINNTMRALGIKKSLTEFSDCKNIGDIISKMKQSDQ